MQKEEKCSGNSARTIFSRSIFHFPLPFRRGDIVWNPYVPKERPGGGPFVFGAAGLDVYKSRPANERMLKEGDATDMCARGYFLNTGGEFCVWNVGTYMNLEYYLAPPLPEGRRLKLLSEILLSKQEERTFSALLPEAVYRDLPDTFLENVEKG